MPNSPSSKKSLRQSQTRRELNRQQRATLRTSIRKFRALVDGGATREETDSAFSGVAKRIDRAAAKRLIHPNKAARTKSRLVAYKKAHEGSN